MIGAVRSEDSILDNDGNHSTSLARLLDCGVETLPTLPVLALELLKLTADERSSASDLIQVIGRDPALSARLLKLANSPLFGFPGEVSDISRAAILLGFEEIRNLAVAIAVFDTMVSQGSSRTPYHRSRLWIHCVIVGFLTEILARDEFGLGPGYYAYGLLHDIGKLAVDAYLPEQFKAVLEEIEFRRLPWSQSEIDQIGADHALIGGKLLAHWQMPPTMVMAVTFHHRPWKAGKGREVAGVVYMADLFARMLGYCSFEPETKIELRHFLTMRAISFLTELGWVFEAPLLERLRTKLAGLTADFDPLSL